MNKLVIESHQFIKITYESAYAGNASFYPPQSEQDYFKVYCFFYLLHKHLH